MTAIAASASSQWRVPKPARVFVGYDEREHRAWEVCRHSMRRYSSIPLDITRMDQAALRAAGLYRRAPQPGTWIDDRDGKPFSTAFTFTRFLVPALCQWEGWALFVDCDFAFLGDLKELWELRNDDFAVMCVHHAHAPDETQKMDEREQTLYWRKNWSSLVLWNCGHPANADLTPDIVSRKPGGWLHGFMWLEDKHIGSLPHGWNWLEDLGCDACRDTDAKDIKAVHYTRGGPWFPAWHYVRYAEHWHAEEASLRQYEETLKYREAAGE